MTLVNPNPSATNPNAIVPSAESHELVVMERTPIAPIDAAALVKQATIQATVLANLIEQRGLYVSMGRDRRGKERRHVVVEGWQTLGALNGLQGYTDSVEAGRDEEGHYWARAIVSARRVTDGVAVARAEGFCSQSESKWRDRDQYAIRSMAQTRGTSKVFRQAFAWVMVLAGFEATPAEEIGPASTTRPFRAMPVSDDDWLTIRAAITTDDKPNDAAKSPGVIHFMDEYGIRGWPDFRARGGDLVALLLPLLGIETAFDPDSVPGEYEASA